MLRIVYELGWAAASPTMVFTKTAGYRWRSRPLCRERGEARGTRRCERTSGEPCREAVEVDGRGGGHVLQAGLGHPAVARPAQAEGADALRDRALDTLALGVEPAARPAVLPHPGSGCPLVLRGGGKAEPPARGPGATRLRRAGPAIGRAEAHPEVEPTGHLV